MIFMVLAFTVDSLQTIVTYTDSNEYLSIVLCAVMMLMILCLEFI